MPDLADRFGRQPDDTLDDLDVVTAARDRYAHQRDQAHATITDLEAQLAIVTRERDLERQRLKATAEALHQARTQITAARTLLQATNADRPGSSRRAQDPEIEAALARVERPVDLRFGVR